MLQKKKFSTYRKVVYIESKGNFLFILQKYIFLYHRSIHSYIERVYTFV